MNSKREFWIDIAKAFSIIAIVMGHSDNKDISKYLFWFHVPIFFIISGYLFNPIKSKEEFYITLTKRFKQLIIPYVTVLIIDTIYMYFVIINSGKFNTITFIKDLIKALLGGNYHYSYYSAIWFLPCLFFTQALFMLLFMKIKSTKHKILIILIAYFLAHLQSIYMNSYEFVKLPLNIDVVLISIFYFSFGYYTKTYLRKISNVQGMILALFSVLIILLNYHGVLDYELGLKRNAYSNFILDAIIPIIFSIVIFYLSQQIANKSNLKVLISILTAIGTRSLVIMYFHKNINRIINTYIYYDYVLYTIIGVLVPYLVSIFVIERFNITKFLFLGNSDSRKL